MSLRIRLGENVYETVSAADAVEVVPCPALLWSPALRPPFTALAYHRGKILPVEACAPHPAPAYLLVLRSGTARLIWDLPEFLDDAAPLEHAA